jgi:hypothetical protein
VTNLHLVPLTLPQANAVVARLHRHHAPLPGGFSWWSVGVVSNSIVVGAAIAGRPTNRNNDDGQTVEVQRVATDGTPHVPSMLLGSCARAAKAIGARRIITYTLSSETGSSLKGAGWVHESEGIRSWWTTGTTRSRAVDRPHMEETKVRWALHFSSVPPLTFVDPRTYSNRDDVSTALELFQSEPSRTS